MPTEPMTPEYLTSLIRNSLAAGGFSPGNADTVSRHLVDAEMKGVSSHGVNRLGLYLNEAAADVIDPKAEPVVTAPRDGLLHVDGGHTYNECMHDLLTFRSLLGEGLSSPSMTILIANIPALDRR